MIEDEAIANANDVWDGIKAPVTKCLINETRVAKRDYVCNYCGKAIKAGETYKYTLMENGDKDKTHKTYRIHNYSGWTSNCPQDEAK